MSTELELVAPLSHQLGRPGVEAAVTALGRAPEPAYVDLLRLMWREPQPGNRMAWAGALQHVWRLNSLRVWKAADGNRARIVRWFEFAAWNAPLPTYFRSVCGSCADLAPELDVFRSGCAEPAVFAGGLSWTRDRRAAGR